MTVLEQLQKRGLIAQATHLDKIESLLNNQHVTFYTGFDATADSLHIGHFLQLVVMAHLQKAGHRPVVLLGTGTTLIGDPTGKTDMRRMLTKQDIAHNAACFKRQIERFIQFDGERALLLQNGEWLQDLNYLSFMREVGVHFSVNKMLAAECYKSRLERGLSFFELNYMLLQSYDFLHLHKTVGCKLQLGGDDQWSNILGGVNLVRRVAGEEVYGMTFRLLTTKQGKKMGKTEQGALWLDADKTSPYDFFQYWRNVGDDDVINCLKLLTFIPIEEIETMEHLCGEALNPVKQRLAFEVTKMVHGEIEATRAQETARSLFVNKSDMDDMPSTVVNIQDLHNGAIGVLDVLLKAGLCASKAEARRLIQQGGLSMDGVKCSDPMMVWTQQDFEKGAVVIKKGKKVFHKIVFA